MKLNCHYAHTVASGGVAFRPVLAASQCLPFGERCGSFGVGDASQFDRFPLLPLAGYVFRVLQPIRLLLAECELS